MQDLGLIGTVATVLRVGVGAVFVAAAVAKFALGRERLARVIDSYGVFPRPLVLTASQILPSTELLVGSLLVVGLWTGAAAAVAIVLLTFFSIAMAVAIRRGRIDSCGCFGRAVAQRLRWRLVARNGALIVAAATVLLTDGGLTTIGTVLAQSASQGGIR